jgi:hypothetical protein
MQQTAIYSVIGDNGIPINYSVNFQINVISEDDIAPVGRGVSRVKTATDNDPIGNSFGYKIQYERDVNTNNPSGLVKDGVTYFNRYMSGYLTEYKSSSNVRPYPDQGHNDKPFLSPLLQHELGHTMLGSQYTYWFHLQNHTTMTSNERKNPLAKLLGVDVNNLEDGNQLPNLFFSTVLSQSGLGSMKDAPIIPYGDATNPSAGIVQESGDIPANFNNGQVLNGK